MYGLHFQQIRAWINPVHGCQGQLNRKPVCALSQFAPENLASRYGFGRPVPRQPAHYPHSDSIWCLLTGFLPISATESIYPANRHRVILRLIRSCNCRRRSLPRFLRRPQRSSSKGFAYSGNPIDLILCATFSPRPLLLQWMYAVQTVSEA